MVFSLPGLTGARTWCTRWTILNIFRCRQNTKSRKKWANISQEICWQFSLVWVRGLSLMLNFCFNSFFPDPFVWHEDLRWKSDVVNDFLFKHLFSWHQCFISEWHLLNLILFLEWQFLFTCEIYNSKGKSENERAKTTTKRTKNQVFKKWATKILTNNFVIVIHAFCERMNNSAVLIKLNLKQNINIFASNRWLKLTVCLLIGEKLKKKETAKKRRGNYECIQELQMQYILSLL